LHCAAVYPEASSARQRVANARFWQRACRQRGDGANVDRPDGERGEIHFWKAVQLEQIARGALCEIREIKRLLRAESWDGLWE